MAVHKPMYSYRVYLENLEEHEAVIVMARQDGHGKSISSWIRMLIVSEMTKRGIGGAAIPSRQSNNTIIPDPNWEDKLVPHPVTGVLTRAGDINWITTDEDEKSKEESIADYLGLNKEKE